MGEGEGEPEPEPEPEDDGDQEESRDPTPSSPHTYSPTLAPVTAEDDLTNLISMDCFIFL